MGSIRLKQSKQTMKVTEALFLQRGNKKIKEISVSSVSKCALQQVSMLSSSTQGFWNEIELE